MRVNEDLHIHKTRIYLQSLHVRKRSLGISGRATRVPISNNDRGDHQREYDRRE
jgi:hypothetical protein